VKVTETVQLELAGTLVPQVDPDRPKGPEATTEEIDRAALPEFVTVSDSGAEVELTLVSGKLRLDGLTEKAGPLASPVPERE
jgi:hypothetical protein